MGGGNGGGGGGGGLGGGGGGGGGCRCRLDAYMRRLWGLKGLGEEKSTGSHRTTCRMKGNQKHDMTLYIRRSVQFKMFPIDTHQNSNPNRNP